MRNVIDGQGPALATQENAMPPTAIDAFTAAPPARNERHMEPRQRPRRSEPADHSSQPHTDHSRPQATSSSKDSARANEAAKRPSSANGDGNEPQEFGDHLAVNANDTAATATPVMASLLMTDSPNTVLTTTATVATAVALDLPADSLAPATPLTLATLDDATPGLTPLIAGTVNTTDPEATDPDAPTRIITSDGKVTTMANGSQADSATSQAAASSEPAPINLGQSHERSNTGEQRPGSEATSGGTAADSAPAASSTTTTMAEQQANDDGDHQHDSKQPAPGEALTSQRPTTATSEAEVAIKAIGASSAANRDIGPATPPQLTNATTPTATTTDTSSPADRALSQQIRHAVLGQLEDGARVLRLRLTPPELGTVRIEISERGGQLQIKLGAEDDGVRHAIERSLPGLRQDLRASDAPIAELRLIDQHQAFHHGQHANGNGQDQSGERRSNVFSLDGEQTNNDDLPATASTADLGGRADANGVDARA
ncbi:MAG: flagellar hook-length control protein FliK [Planctomycetota bacterium]